MKCVYVFSETDKDAMLGMGYVLLWADIENETYIFAVAEDSEEKFTAMGIPLTVSSTLLF